MVRHVLLDRQFSIVSEGNENTNSEEFFSALGRVSATTWKELDHEFRCIILAEAGAGKTEEFRLRASHLENQGKLSFFIRIEDIATDFSDAFEVGEEEQFHRWLQSTDEAWFFLDSVDEARLENPGALRKALRRFAKSIKGSEHRAHIYISSRPYAWHPKEDRRLLDETLFLTAPCGANDAAEQSPAVDSALTVYTMRPLNVERIRRFCEAFAVNDIDRLLREIERAYLWSLAERPFDLEAILSKWSEDKVLGGRLELLRHNIDKRLRDDHNIDRAQRQPLNFEKAKEGARCLAAAVILSGKAGLNVPDSMSVKPGIDAEAVLANWPPEDVHALLDRGIFNDIIYGAVRFRHREVRELLAAEWFDGLLKSGNSRHTIEALFFREQYGEKIIVPRLRPVLPWLILLDNEIRAQALELQPEIALESGDPSRLPLPERQGILVDVVRRIASDEDYHSAQDNSSIARIATHDLSSDALQLIHIYRNNDDAIFFLGRLAWQGDISSCVPPLVDIAVDGMRGVYARIASVRAIMACGSKEEKRLMWALINESDIPTPRELLAEILVGAESDIQSVEYFLVSLGKLPPYERFRASGLTRAIHEFVNRLPILNEQQAIIRLIDGLHEYLENEPYVERGECHVSEKFTWLLSPAIHTVQRLVNERCPAALGSTALSIMLMVPAVRFWKKDDFPEYKDNLRQLVPLWPELNDALYWASIEQAKLNNALRSSKPLINDHLVSWLGHFWNFDTTSLPRLLDFVQSRELLEDKLVALSTSFGIYIQSAKHAGILSSLENAVAKNEDLQCQLNTLLNPQVSQSMRKYEERHEANELKNAKKEKQKQQNRDAWIVDLRANPDRVRYLPNLQPSEWSNDQFWLLNEILDSELTASRSSGANWQLLIPDFGDAVALAYRDAAINYWQQYNPTIQSEGDIRDNTVSYALLFAMAGLEIEATEIAGFPHYLSAPKVVHALRYITWELNGFPSWFESIHKTFPALTEDAVSIELLWELENVESDKPMHYILSDLAYHAPWFHSAISPAILDWVRASNTPLNLNKYDCLRILINGGTDLARLKELARQQIALNQGPEKIACWYALLVDCDPANSIPELERWLSGLEAEEAVQAAQIFVTSLVGGNRESNRPHIENFRTSSHLKSLYVLMHRFIRVEDDINRAGGSSYSPGIRDDAQEARNRLFNLLSECPGKDSYIAIKSLAEEHPVHDYRSWMAKQAYKRAEADGNLELWSAEQVYEFNRSQVITPTTHCQLFDLTVHRLQDLKNWLERGNDSAWKTWQRAANETETRTLIAGWLNQHCREQYTTAQEPELANSQRMDIWLHNTSVRSPVPIELKLLDKNWSGPDLCERLRNQLAGDYLREETAGCGVMLLVSQNISPSRYWMINGRRVSLSGLSDALKSYWNEISGSYPGVETIDVIIIDLTQRAQVSNS